MGTKGREKTGGRKKGTSNKPTLALEEIAARRGVHPFEILVCYIQGDWEGVGLKSETSIRYTQSGMPYEVDNITVDHRLKAALEACQYLYPKRKTIEIDIKDIDDDTFTLEAARRLEKREDK